MWSLSFSILVFFALWFMISRFPSSLASFAIVFIHYFSLSTPVALVLNQHLLESFEYLILRKRGAAAINMSLVFSRDKFCKETQGFTHLAYLE